MNSRWLVLALIVAGALSFSGCGGVSMAGNPSTAATTYTVGGTISGLTASGLQLQNNGGNTQSIASGATSFSFTGIASGSSYSIAVSANPTGQTCTVTSGGSGTATGNVSNVVVTCTNTTTNYIISAAVTGLSGTLVLQDVVAGTTDDDLTITSNGTFPFAIQVPSGDSYAVSVLTQPSGQTCTLGTNASGTATTNVTVAVTCTTGIATNYTISAAVSGLTGTGLMLQDNGGDNLSVTTNGTFPFATQIASGGPYAVTVLTQPSGQTCTLGTNASGTATADVTVAVTCTTVVVTSYTISAAVSGLTGTGLVLQDNGGDNLSITTNGTFPFATQVPSGGSYAVTVLTQPSGQTCSLGSNASGTATANVTVAVTCSSTLYTISVDVSGLTGTGLVFQDNGGDNLSVTANGTFPFATQIASGGAYAVTVFTQPSGQSCSLGSNATGTATANVTVAVTCTALYTISAAVSGLSGTLVLQDLVAGVENSLTVTTNGTFPFTTQVPSGGTYAVTVLTQPSGQTCTLGSNASGTATSNVTVAVTCASTTLYTVSIAITGLTSGSLVVQDNPGNNLTETTNGTFAFSPQIPSGGSYDVAVVTQPSGLTCTPGSNASGTLTGNVTVNVTCAPAAVGGTWTWESGTDITFSQGDYPTTKRKFQAGIFPSSRYGAMTWTDLSGNLWIFGGFGDDSTGNQGYLNDLWEYSPTLGQWSWVNGSNGENVNGVYNTIGEPTGTTDPGGRYAAGTWTDSSGNLWLFGGYGLDSNVNDTAGQLNDLWEFNTTTGQWTWWGPSISETFQEPGVYGTKGTASANNYPGARYSPSTYIDASGNFWLFGGLGYDGKLSDGTGSLNDLWEYNPTAQTWEWVSGSSSENQAGTYGTQGTTNVNNVPGARYGGVSWIDSSGNFWVFGGLGIDGSSPPITGDLNDLWEFFPSVGSGEWAWQGPVGSDVADQPSNYPAAIGEQGGNPGGRLWPSGWLDSNGNFWLFGGQQDEYGLNDLWEYSAGNWTWQSGSSSLNELGTYPASPGPGATGTPGSRYEAGGWIDKSNNLWIFGGYGAAAAYPIGYLNDLWEFVP